MDPLHFIHSHMRLLYLAAEIPYLGFVLMKQRRKNCLLFYLVLLISNKITLNDGTADGKHNYCPSININN